MYAQSGRLGSERSGHNFHRPRIEPRLKPRGANEQTKLENIARTISGDILTVCNNDDLDQLFLGCLGQVGFLTAGYLRIFGEGRFHAATFLFGATVPGWSERYQANCYSTLDPVITAASRSTGAFTLEEAAERSREGAQILADSRTLGLIDGLVTPVRSGYDEVGFVLIGSDRRLILSAYERLLLQAMCEVYGRAGLALLPHDEPPSLTRRETECLRWVAAGRSDPQIGMILGLSPNTVHAHVEAAKTKLNANSRAQLVLRAAMSGLLRSDSCG